MRVIRKTILDKIDEEIDKDSDSIVKIELNNDESKDFTNVMPNVDKESIHIIVTPSGDYSGSSVLYRGVCIQVRESYE